MISSASACLRLTLHRRVVLRNCALGELVELVYDNPEGDHKGCKSLLAVNYVVDKPRAFCCLVFTTLTRPP